MRKLTVSLVVGGLLASFVLVLAEARVNLAGSVAICHVPPGNPGNTHVINVGPAAVKAHVKNHGDAVCAAGDRDCCGTGDGALCTNLATDAGNCGACGNVCGAEQTCAEGQCTRTCSQDLDPCVTTSDCCDGLVCFNDGTCGRACSDVLDPCVTTSDCCDGLVCFADGTCDLQCGLLGDSCSGDTDCCSGLVCISSSCS